MTRLALVSLTFTFVVGTLSAQSYRRGYRQYDDCRVSGNEELKNYIGQKLDRKYKGHREAKNIAEMLYEGPLMRDADAEGRDALTRLFDKTLDVREISEIVRGHIYGKSDEFYDLLKELEKKYEGDEREASFKLLDSIYDAFRYRPYNREEEDFDACLILDRKADLVITKALVDWMERHDLH
jgi:hypothetical protein